MAQMGLLLMLVVARLACRGYADGQTDAPGVAPFLARRAIDGIAAIGWLTDHLGRPATIGGLR